MHGYLNSALFCMDGRPSTARHLDAMTTVMQCPLDAPMLTVFCPLSPQITKHRHQQATSVVVDQRPASGLYAHPPAHSYRMATNTIRRTVSSATSMVNPRPLASGASSKPSLFAPNTHQRLVMSASTVTAMMHKDNHKKLDRSFSEPAEKKGLTCSLSGNSAPVAGGAPSAVAPSSRYKTELCRSFAEVGACKYGDKCQFAHGEDELRTVTRHPKFKTENCKSFHTTGFCPYGPRCHFIHNDESKPKQMSDVNSSSGLQPQPSGQNIASPAAVNGQQRSMFEGNSIPAPGPLMAKTSPFDNNASGDDVLRPKAMSLGSYSLGSSGEMSPPSSQSGSPTSLNSFLYNDNELGYPAFNTNGVRINHAGHLTVGQSNAFSFSSDSAFVSFNSASSSPNNSLGNNSALFSALDSSRMIFNPLNFQDAEQTTSETANNVISSLFNASPRNTPFTGESSMYVRALSPPPKHLYPASPESPVDSTSSELESFALGGQGCTPGYGRPCASSSLSAASCESEPQQFSRLPTFARFSLLDQV